MKLSNWFSKVDRAQQGLMFKIIASVVILIGFLTYAGFSVVGATTNDQESPGPVIQEMLQDQNGNLIPNPIAQRDAQLRSILDVSKSPVSGIVSVSLISGFLFVIVWLGLGLTYIGTVAIVATIGWPLFSLGGPGWSSLGFVVIGVTMLMLSFTVLLRAMRLALSSAHPITTIARNVLAEAIRMKISIVFIVTLAVILAVMPMLRNVEQPLRYQVQAFLQWSTGASFWLIALLVVFFSAATVSYEQREKVIWQTMTKPVAAWQYIIGKWLGVTLLSGMLLAVAALGIFQFTDYLRSHKALGEVAPYQAGDNIVITEDRLILETQVLTARKSLTPILPFNPRDPEFDSALEEEVQKERQLQTNFNPTPRQLSGMRMKIYQDTVSDYRSIDPRTEGYATFSFKGLSDAKKAGRPLTLRYKINAEGNRPDIFYAVTFVFEQGTIIPRNQTGLGISHTFTIDPGLISNTGELNVQIYNGQLGMDRSDGFSLKPNSGTMTIPPDGLEISYQVGTFGANFVRIMGVLWVKLALLAMISVWASCFASFPVACLMSISVFLIGESAGFVQSALPAWQMDTDSVVGVVRTGIFYFANTVSNFFSIYHELKPTQRIADGQVLGWSQVSSGVLILSTATALFYLLSVYIFRRRQLAIYSGH
ncbi:MAG: ABC transporter permease [Phycisphaerales bacterium]